MKISVDVDCTPEEARRFLGLPDLTPLNDALVARFRNAAEGGGLDMMRDMVARWGPMGEAGLAAWRQMFEQGGGSKPD